MLPPSKFDAEILFYLLYLLIGGEEFVKKIVGTMINIIHIHFIAINGLKLNYIVKIRYTGLVMSYAKHSKAGLRQGTGPLKLA